MASPVPSKALPSDSVVMENVPLCVVGEPTYMYCMLRAVVCERVALRSIFRLRTGSRVSLICKSSVLLVVAGVAEGMVVNVPGKGNAAPHNGINGNIQVYIEEEPNDTFVRDGNDIIYNLLLDIPTAVLGGTVEIPTIDGTKVKIKIEPGTQPGKSLRLRGKGLPSVQGYGSGNGDLVVNISVFIPKTLTREEHKAIESLRDSENFKGDKDTKQSIFEKFKNYFS